MNEFTLGMSVAICMMGYSNRMAVHRVYGKVVWFHAIPISFIPGE